MRACALVERPSWTCSRPAGSGRSSMYRASPVTWRRALSWVRGSWTAPWMRSDMGEAPLADDAGRGRAGGLEMQPAQQVAGNSEPVAGGGPHVRDRLEILAEGGHAGLYRGVGPGPSHDCGLGMGRSLGRGRHAAEGQARLGHPVAVEAQLERRHHGRYILVEALADLVGAVARAGRRPGHGDALDELAGAASLLAVCDEELLERQAAEVAPAAQL